VEEKNGRSLQEVLNEIYQMPLAEQKTIVETLSLKIKKESKKAELSTNEVYQILFEKGLITHIPTGLSAAKDGFTPLKIEGEPLSETIIQERR
jgi:hypothetical protein